MGQPERRARMAAVRLYLVTPTRPGGRDVADVVTAALRGGVDCVQVRGKDDPDETVLAALDALRGPCARHGAPLIVNDRPDLAAASGVDGVHLGQDDETVGAARRALGEEALIGLSTHTATELDAARAARGDDAPDYVGAGPVHATPTKAGRPAVGLAHVRRAADDDPPAVAIGGIDVTNAAAAVAAGARRLAVVRAIADAPDPERAAAALRRIVDAGRRS